MMDVVIGVSAGLGSIELEWLVIVPTSRGSVALAFGPRLANDILPPTSPFGRLVRSAICSARALSSKIHALLSRAKPLVAAAVPGTRDNHA